MLLPILSQIEEYLRYPEEYQVLGVVSVEGSPSCGYHMTCSGKWGGELSVDADEIKKMQNTCETVNAPGVFMEVLEKEFMSRAMDVSIMSMEEACFRCDIRNLRSGKAGKNHRKSNRSRIENILSKTAE